MNLKTKLFATAAAAALAIGLGGGVSAQTTSKDLTVTVTENANAQLIYYFDDSANAVAFGTADINGLGGATLTGTATIYVVDARLSPEDLGFQLSVEADLPFQDDGPPVLTFSESNARVDSAAAPVAVTRAPYTASSGNLGTVSVPAGAVDAPLDNPVNVVNGANGTNAQFTQLLNLELTVPADTPAGTYTTTLQLTGIAADP
jgi:hypothetical protein